MPYGVPYGLWGGYGAQNALPGPFAQGYHPFNKQDTVFLSFQVTASADLSLDVSQEATDLVSSGSFMTEFGNTRFILDNTAREVSVRINATTATTGTLVNWGSTGGSANIVWEMYIADDATGRLIVARDQLIAECVLPGINAANPQDYTISWSSRSNPVGSGSNANISEVFIFNHTSGTFTGSFAKLDDSPPTGGDANDTFTIGARTGGTFPVTNISNIKKVRISKQYHTFAEAHLDFVANIPTRQPLCAVRRDPLVMDRASGIGDEGQFWGPPMQFSAVTHDSGSHKLNSPLINEIWKDAPLWNLNSTDNDTTGSLWRAIPGSGSNSEYEMFMGWLRWVETPENMSLNKIQWRANVLHDSALPLKMRFVQMTKLPDALNAAVNPPIPSFEMSFDEVDVHTGSEAQWVSGSAFIVRAETGPLSSKHTTLVCLAVSGSLGAGNSFKIHAFEAWACNEPGATNGLGGGIGEEQGG